MVKRCQSNPCLAPQKTFRNGSEACLRYSASKWQFPFVCQTNPEVLKPVKIGTSALCFNPLSLAKSNTEPSDTTRNNQLRVGSNWRNHHPVSFASHTGSHKIRGAQNGELPDWFPHLLETPMFNGHDVDKGHGHIQLFYIWPT